MDIVERNPFCLNAVESPVSPVAAITAELDILLVIVGAPIDDFPSVFHDAPC